MMWQRSVRQIILDMRKSRSMTGQGETQSGGECQYFDEAYERGMKTAESGSFRTGCEYVLCG